MQRLEIHTFYEFYEFYHIGCNKAVIRGIIRFLLHGYGEPNTVAVWVK